MFMQYSIMGLIHHSSGIDTKLVTNAIPSYEIWPNLSVFPSYVLDDTTGASRSKAWNGGLEHALNGLWHPSLSWFDNLPTLASKTGRSRRNTEWSSWSSGDLYGFLCLHQRTWAEHPLSGRAIFSGSVDMSARFQQWVLEQQHQSAQLERQGLIQSWAIVFQMTTGESHLALMCIRRWLLTSLNFDCSSFLHL